MFKSFFLFLIPALGYASVCIAVDLKMQSNNDVQLLQAWLVKPTITLDYSECNGSIPEPGRTAPFDCTQIKPSKFPAANPWMIDVYADARTPRIYSPTNVGNTVEIRVVVRESILKSKAATKFEGIGFYSSNLTYEGMHFIPTEKLVPASTQRVTLPTGEKAYVLGFTLWFPGVQGNSATGWNMGSVSFKPYAQFSDQTTTYINWENTPTNYRIYRADFGSGSTKQITSIDRQKEVLK
ncbi:MAG: hypothetical protein K2X47_11280 [Bdellovibrionales bacterium]|nr:hypothetical protein [Bdellovibrionales bacterium]